jgi:hypothetical protein
MKAALLFILFAGSLLAAPKVSLVHLPMHGKQPQVDTDAKGVAHIVFLSGKERATDVFYVTRSGGKFSKPMKVNQIAGSAVAVGTIRGPHIAVGKYGRVHIAWNGSQAGGGTPHHGSPMFYTRMRIDGSGFEKERNLMTWTTALDGGGSVAADGKGNVYVVWHAAPKNTPKGENVRGVFVATSTDGGKTFAKEKTISTKKGTCGCCGLKSFVDAKGKLYTLYRGAQKFVNRDMTLLIGSESGKVNEKIVGPWRIGQCVMSSAAFVQTSNGVLGAWETEGNIFIGQLGGKGEPTKIAKHARQRHPALAVNKAGEVLVTWSENTGWKKAGKFAFEVLAKDGQRIPTHGGQQSVPVWSLTAAYALPDGSFEILH